MVYDFDGILGKLKELKASQYLVEQISWLANRAGNVEEATAGLRSLVSDLTETVSDAESNPLSERATKSLEAEREVLLYLDSVLCSRE